MKLHAIKAEEGDCLMLESGDPEPRHVLIDGGPPGTWEAVAGEHVRSVIGKGGSLDVVVVSHVDADHIIGVLDLLAEIERDRANKSVALSVKDLWHNSFVQTIDTEDGAISKGLQAILDVASAQRYAMAEAAISFFGIAEGARLRRAATKLSVPINAAFDGGTISPSSLLNPTRVYGRMSLTVVGPTAKSFADLRKAWLAWLQSEGDRTATVEALARADRSVPNLSSIVLLAEEDGKRVLLTGDARGDHILQGLEAGGLLHDGRIHLDVLKLQHHGSQRNVDKTFFERVTADTYVISANGRHGNPDEATLVWLVEAARSQGRRARILITHDTPSLRAFLGSHPPKEWNFDWMVADGAAHVIEF